MRLVSLILNLLTQRDVHGVPYGVTYGEHTFIPRLNCCVHRDRVTISIEVAVYSRYRVPGEQTIRDRKHSTLDGQEKCDTDAKRNARFVRDGTAIVCRP